MEKWGATTTLSVAQKQQKNALTCCFWVNQKVKIAIFRKYKRRKISINQYSAFENFAVVGQK